MNEAYSAFEYSPGRVRGTGPTRWRWLAVLAPIVFATQASAHHPDTSYARFKVSREALDAAFTLDITTLVRIVPDLDANGDHRLTPDELNAQTPAIVDYLRWHIALEVSGATRDFGELRPVIWPADTGQAIAEKDYHAAKALVTFALHMPLDRAPADFWVEFAFFDKLGAEHTVLSMIEQDGRAEEVVFRENEPNYLYDTGYGTASPTQPDRANAIAAQGSKPASPEAQSAPVRRSADATPWSHVVQFFRLGVEHIFLGYDHILFLLSLMIVSRFGDLVKTVTAFTLAHTVTLILATLKVVYVPREWVEIAIAATIIFTALENFWIRPGDAAGRRRWMLAFGFGLIHGFGFAGVLSDLGLPAAGLVRALLSFNVGVEAGQMAIVAALYPLVVLVRSWRYGHAGQLAVSAVIALCGFGWLLDRTLGLGIMPV